LVGGSEFPPFSNLFIVASHADPGQIDSDDVLEVFESAGSRIMRQLGEFAIDEKSKRIGINIQEGQLVERLSLFWKGRDETCLTFGDQLLRLLAMQLPEVWKKRAQIEIDKFKRHKVAMISEAIEAYDRRLNDLWTMEKTYLKYLEEEPSRKHSMQQKVAGIINQIRQFSSQSSNEFRDDFNASTEPVRLERLIRDKFQNKREAEEYAIGYVHELISKSLKNILTPKTQRISDATEVFVKEYRDQQIFEGSAIKVGLTADDMGTFLVGATATGTLGALASLGLTFGGSWLAAHATGLLAAVGIGAANVGAAIAAGIAYALSALTGPIGIAIISVIALFSFFRAPWQERLAKEIAKKMADGNVLSRFLVAIDQYWKDTEKAFLGGVGELDRRWEQGLEELRDQIAHPEEGERRLSAILGAMTHARDFF
jgi:hypothetical protein